jgi:hypothetical protein
VRKNLSGQIINLPAVSDKLQDKPLIKLALILAKNVNFGDKSSANRVANSA